MQTLDQVMVRRLKTDIKNTDGTKRFPARRIMAVDIPLPTKTSTGWTASSTGTEPSDDDPGSDGRRVGVVISEGCPRAWR